MSNFTKSLVKDFPSDPYSPSLRYAATSQLPITVPWTTQPIKLGTSLKVSKIDGLETKFSDDFAFSLPSLQTSHLIYTNISNGEVFEVSSLGSSRVAEHTSLSVAGSIGGSILGVSGQAQYQQQVMNSDSSLKTSFRTTYRGGKITFKELPSLSPDARNILRNSGRPHEAFQEKYGDYFVAAYLIGGSNANMLGTASSFSSSRSDLSGSYTTKVFFIESTETFGEHSAVATSSDQATLVAYDSLQSYNEYMQAPGKTPHSQLMTSARTNGNRAWSVQRRLEDKAKQLGLSLRNSAEMSWESSEKLCSEAMVVELLLLPYAGLRSFKEGVLEGPSS